MANPKQQLELREVIIVSTHDGSTVRTTTNIRFTHSKQLLNAARDPEGPLPLDCSPATMCILEKLFWAEPWEDAVNALRHEVGCSIRLARASPVRALHTASRTLQELLDLFEVAQAWQIDVLVQGMPDWIRNRRWEIPKAKSALGNLYARAELPDSMQQAALETLLASKPNGAELVQLVPRPRAGDLTKLVSLHETNVRDAVEYLSCITGPPLPIAFANCMLEQLNPACRALLANKQRRVAELQFVDALRCICKCRMSVCRTAFFFPHQELPDAEAPAVVKSSSLAECMADMLAHYLSKLV